jgi:hypothetical protein
MCRQRELPMHQIVGMDAAGKAAPGGLLGCQLMLRDAEMAEPLKPVAVELPAIGGIARRFESGRQPAR